MAQPVEEDRGPAKSSARGRQGPAGAGRIRSGQLRPFGRAGGDQGAIHQRGSWPASRSSSRSPSPSSRWRWSAMPPSRRRR